MKYKRDGWVYKLAKTNLVCGDCAFRGAGIVCPRNKNTDALDCAFKKDGGLRRGVHNFRETLPSKIRGWIKRQGK